MPSGVGIPVKVELAEPETLIEEALETMMEEMAPEAEDGLPDSFEADETMSTKNG